MPVSMHCKHKHMVTAEELIQYTLPLLLPIHCSCLKGNLMEKVQTQFWGHPCSCMKTAHVWPLPQKAHQCLVTEILPLLMVLLADPVSCWYLIVDNGGGPWSCWQLMVDQDGEPPIESVDLDDGLWMMVDPDQCQLIVDYYFQQDCLINNMPTQITLHYWQ